MTDFVKRKMYRMLSTDFHLLNCLLLFLGPTGNNYQESEKFVLCVFHEQRNITKGAWHPHQLNQTSITTNQQIWKNPRAHIAKFRMACIKNVNFRPLINDAIWMRLYSSIGYMHTMYILSIRKIRKLKYSISIDLFLKSTLLI